MTEQPTCGWNPATTSTDCDWDRTCPVHGTGQQQRLTVDTITPDALTQLYVRLEAAEADAGLLRHRATRLRDRSERLRGERDMYASAIRQLILQVRQTAHVWSTTLPDTIRTADVAQALYSLCSPKPLPEGLRDDLWQRIVAAYYLRFENDGHPEDAKAAADEAMAIVQPELDCLRDELEQARKGEAAALLKAADYFQGVLDQVQKPEENAYYWNGVQHVVQGLRRQAADLDRSTP